MDDDDDDVDDALTHEFPGRVLSRASRMRERM